MPSAENAPPQNANRAFYLRLGQLIMAFALAWLILSATVRVSDTIMILGVFFGVVGLMMIIASRQMPKEAYIFSVLKKIMFPLLISVAALMLSAILLDIPLVSFSAYMGNLPLIFVMTLALEAII